MLNRRGFLQTSAGCLALAVGPGAWSVENALGPWRPCPFQPFEPGKTLGPTRQITPPGGHYVQTYFDVTPFSPSQRYCAVTKLPFDDRMPVLGDPAEVCLIDLERQAIRTVFATKCWGYQTGANVNWGASDRRLFANDVIGGAAVCVRIDLESGETAAFAGPLYTIAPDESCALGFPHELRDATQLGYGVPSKDWRNPKRLAPGAAADEGVWSTNLQTNEKTLILSLAQAAAAVPVPPPRDIAGGTWYFWHTKFNRQGTRLMQVLRYMAPSGPPEERNPMTLTLRPDGADVRYGPKTGRVPVYGNGGGHPSWHADGEHILRNLAPDGGPERFCQFRFDGTDFRILSETIGAGGHPSIEPNGRYIVTDENAEHNGGAGKNIRLIDLSAQEERSVCRCGTIDKKTIPDPVFRLDGHPCWSRDFRMVSFQALVGGWRQLLIADLSEILGEAG